MTESHASNERADMARKELEEAQAASYWPHAYIKREARLNNFGRNIRAMLERKNEHG